MVRIKWDGSAEPLKYYPECRCARILAVPGIYLFNIGCLPSPVKQIGNDMLSAHSIWVHAKNYHSIIKLMLSGEPGKWWVASRN